VKVLAFFIKVANLDQLKHLDGAYISQLNHLYHIMRGLGTPLLFKSLIKNYFAKLTMLEKYGFRLCHADNRIILFLCLSCVHRTYRICAQSVVANCGCSVVLGMIKDFNGSIYVTGSLEFFMRFTKQALVRFLLCLIMDHIKLSLVFVNIRPW
jgi:hypothetical protein